MNKEIKQYGIRFMSFAKNAIMYNNPNQKFEYWGEDNLLPLQYIKMYNEIPEHSSCIKFTTDAILEGINTDIINKWVLKKIVKDFNIFGGYALQVIKTRGNGNKIAYVDISNCRYTLDKKQIAYSEEWGKYKREVSYFNITNTLDKEGIFIYKSNDSRGVYPTPDYVSAYKSLDTMRAIIDYHNNNATNGFSPSCVINFNNGIPDDETQKNIEDGIKKKFTGEVGQKFIMSFNESVDTKTTIEPLITDNLDEKFETLQKFIQNQIIVSHRLTSGCLIGIVPESQGFTSTEFQESLDVFNKVVVNGLRDELIYSFSIILGEDINNKEVK